MYMLEQKIHFYRLFIDYLTNIDIPLFASGPVAAEVELVVSAHVALVVEQPHLLYFPGFQPEIGNSW